MASHIPRVNHGRRFRRWIDVSYWSPPPWADPTNVRPHNARGVFLDGGVLVVHIIQFDIAWNYRLIKEPNGESWISKTRSYVQHSTRFVGIRIRG